MEINKLNQTQSIVVEKKVQSEKIKETGLKQDSFKKEEESFDPIVAKNFLEGLKNSYGYSRYTDSDYVNKIIKNVSEKPEKWAYIKILASNNNLPQYAVADYSKESLDNLKVLSEFSEIKNLKDRNRFGYPVINHVLKLDEEQKDGLRVLSKTLLSTENIMSAVNEKGLNYKKLAEKANEMLETIGEKNLSSQIFKRDEYSKGEYKIVGMKQNGDSVSELYDKNVKRLSLETSEHMKSKDSKKVLVQKSIDYRNNTTSKVRYVDDILENEIRIVKDKNGKVERTEYTAPSDIKGVMDVKYMYPNGKVEQISSGTIDKKTGITSIKKNMTSPLGTKTEYLFEDDPQGNRISDYKITDKNGNVLLNNSESFEVLDKNHFISAKNNQRYEIFADDVDGSKHTYSVTVKDLNNPERVATFKTQEEIFGDYKKMIDVLKQMPGEELFKLKENTSKLYGIDDVLNSYSKTSKESREIHTGDDLFVILHELGHAVDMKKVDMTKEKETIDKALFEDKKFNEIYEKEKAAFNKMYPDIQRSHISYFINHETHYNGEIGGKRETIAESNALLTTAKSHEVLAMRSQYLQQHFPETIAYLDKKLAESV